MAHSRENPNFNTETVAVIGGGIAGCLAAHELAAEGYAVTILEEDSEMMNGTSRLAIQAHLGGLYSGNIATAKECLTSAISVKKALPFALNGHRASFLVADKSEMPFADYIDFYTELAEHYASLPSEDRVFGQPEDFFRVLSPEEHSFARGIEGGIYTQEPGLDIPCLTSVLIHRLGQLGVRIITNTTVAAAEQHDNGFQLHTQDQNGSTAVFNANQVINAAGYRAAPLDREFGDKTAYNLYLKTWNLVRNAAGQAALPPFYVVRGDFMHHSPVGDTDLVSLITATREGSYLETISYDHEHSEVPSEWLSILRTGQVPDKTQRQRNILDYARDTFLPNAEFELVDLVPGVAVSFSASRQDRTRRSPNQVVPGWQTIIPTKATNALELAKEVRIHAVQHSLQS
jgi:glycine/D-amino acid oxidase-like deaminating enzyme